MRRNRNFMNKTKDLLCKIRTAIEKGQLKIGSIPITYIKNCVHYEIDLHRNTVTEIQYQNILNSFEKLCSNMSDDEWDISKILLFLDAMILCVDMLSESIYSLANRDYWEYKHGNDLENPQVQEIIEYIDRKHQIRLLNYNFMDEYENMLVEVCFDEICQMFYVPYKDRKMFFPKSWDAEKVEKYYRSVVAEQDQRSPHCYAYNGYEVNEGDVVVDVGAAEGIFTLDIINTADKVYLIEADMEWVEALQQTFVNDKNKIQIIYGFADCVAEGDRLTLDSLFENEEINYIKMDIEGYEKPALLGEGTILDNCKNLKCAICSYHCKEDEGWIHNYLKKYGFVTDVSEGFICPDWTLEAYLEAELRRGIVFGKKKIGD